MDGVRLYVRDFVRLSERLSSDVDGTDARSAAFRGNSSPDWRRLPVIFSRRIELCGGYVTLETLLCAIMINS